MLYEPIILMNYYLNEISAELTTYLKLDYLVLQFFYLFLKL